MFSVLCGCIDHRQSVDGTPVGKLGCESLFIGVSTRILLSRHVLDPPYPCCTKYQAERMKRTAFFVSLTVSNVLLPLDHQRCSAAHPLAFVSATIAHLQSSWVSSPCSRQEYRRRDGHHRSHRQYTYRCATRRLHEHHRILEALLSLCVVGRDPQHLYVAIAGGTAPRGPPPPGNRPFLGVGLLQILAEHTEAWS